MRWGLSTELIEKYFTGTASTIEGIGLKEIAEESVRRHRDAYGDNPIYRGMLDVGGDYAFRLRGEGPCLDAGKRLASPACGARQQSGRISAIRPVHQ